MPIITSFTLPKSVYRLFPDIEQLVFNQFTVLLPLTTKFAIELGLRMERKSLYAGVTLEATGSVSAIENRGGSDFAQCAGSRRCKR